MSEPSPTEVTRLLHDAAAGDTVAYDRVFQIVYEELKRRARWIRRGHHATVNTTALVHEAYLRLLPSQQLAWENRSHFLGVAARAMRQVLVAAARRRTAAKRGGAQPDISLDDVAVDRAVVSPEGHGGVSPEAVLALDTALEALEELSPRQARVVEYRYFAGMSVEETAAALDVSAPTIKRDWRAARAWLARRLAEDEA